MKLVASCPYLVHTVIETTLLGPGGLSMACAPHNRRGREDITITLLQNTVITPLLLARLVNFSILAPRPRSASQSVPHFIGVL